VGRSEAWEGLREEESWEGATDGEEGSTDESEAWEGPQDGWGGFTGQQEDRDIDTDREESIRSSTGLQKSWGGSTGVTESSTGLQEQYCSSCNQKKPLIDFGRFFTCNTCRQRNKRANQARHAKQKALLNKSS
jgi:hypothetical protein